MSVLFFAIPARFNLKNTLVISQRQGIIYKIKIKHFKMNNFDTLPFIQTARTHTAEYDPKTKKVLDIRKKKIGPYSFYQQDLIGSGTSGHVYKCIKDNNRQDVYAIKVVKLKEIENPTYHLLKNEISILQLLNHPNILKLHNVYYTKNNCYIITDFCQGGNLQKYIEKIHELPNKTEQFQNKLEQIINQLVQGCKYLLEKLIIHRDIKPANVFLKQGKWKIGDFGFARTIQSKESLVHEKYSIGSPLYMPPETLKKNIYSLKTDSFALGVMLFYLLTNKYPWRGRNKKELVKNYEVKRFPSILLSNIKINENIKGYVTGLLQTNINERLYVTQFEQINNTQLSKSQYTIASSSYEEDSGISQFILKTRLELSEQLKLCLFTHYIDKNIQHFKQMKLLSENLRRNLRYLIDIFQWGQVSTLQRYINQFECSEYKELSSMQQHKFLHALIQKHIEELKGTMIKTCKVLRIKLVELSKIMKSIMQKDEQQFKKSIRGLVLHPEFDNFYLPDEHKGSIMRTSRVNTYN